MPPRQRALALSGAGFIRLAGGDQARARRLFKQSMPLYRQAGDRLGLGLAAAALGHLLAARRETAIASDLLEQTLGQLRQMAASRSPSRSACSTCWMSPWRPTSSARSVSVREITAARRNYSPTAWPRRTARPTGSPSSSRSTTWPSAARPQATWTAPRTCSARACRWRPRPGTSRAWPTTWRRWPPSPRGRTTRSAPPACWPRPARCSRPTAAAGCTPTCRAPRTTTASWPRLRARMTGAAFEQAWAHGRSLTSASTSAVRYALEETTRRPVPPALAAS